MRSTLLRFCHNLEVSVIVNYRFIFGNLTKMQVTSDKTVYQTMAVGTIFLEPGKLIVGIL